jgi:hypothetical protein
MRSDGANRSALGLAACALAALACGNQDSPGGHGNDVVDDTRDAEPRPPANPTPDDGSIPLGEPDASFYLEGGDGDGAPTAPYPGISACDTCTCSAAQGYCFGGATARLGRVTPDARSDAGGDGGLPACVLSSSASPTVGCNALPGGCTDCACLAETLQPAFACYLVCAFDGKQMTVYCPNP